MKKIFRISQIVFAATILFLATGCNEEELAKSSVLESKPPALTTTSVTDITATTAISGGNITYDGGSEIVERGLDLWRRTDNDRGIVFRSIPVGKGTGSFNVSLTGLLPLTTYQVRSYATNRAGTAYGNQISFRTLNTGK